VDLFEEWFEIDLVVLVAWGDGEGEGQLRVCAACGVHPVSEDEASLAPADAGIWVAQAGPVVMAPLAVGLDVGAVDGYDVSLYHTGVNQPSEEVVEDPVVGLLSKAAPEVGEEAVARCPPPESACSRDPPVVSEAEGLPPVAGDAEEVFEKLGFEHRQRVVRPLSRASPVVEASE